MVYRDDHLARAAALDRLAHAVRALASEARASHARRSVPRALEKLAAGIQRDAARAREAVREPRWTASGVLGLALVALVIGAAAGLVIEVRRGWAHGAGHRRMQAETDSMAIRSAVELYLAQDPGARCPGIDELLAERILSSSTRTEDPWGMPYRITCDGDDITVVSSGLDRRLGTEDDVR